MDSLDVSLFFCPAGMSWTLMIQHRFESPKSKLGAVIQEAFANIHIDEHMQGGPRWPPLVACLLKLS